MNKDYNINHFNIVKDLLNITPNIISLNDMYDYNSLISHIKYFKLINNLDEYIPFENNEYIVDSKVLVLIDESNYMSYIISDKLSELPTISNIVFYQNPKTNTNDSISKLISDINRFSLENIDNNSKKQNNTINNLNYLCIGKNGMYVSPLEIENDLDINVSYNKETLKEIKELEKQIKNNDFGVWVLHGKRGLGKTSILKYFAEKNINVNFTYLTHNILDSTINNHEIYDFILNNNQIIFIIDDFEKLYNNFDIKLNQTITNISQLSDNFLFKKSKIGFIIIYNTINNSTDELDELFELNSFKMDIEFNNLEKNKIEKVIKQLNKDIKISKNKPSLSDIINNKNIKEKKYTGF
jgi:hypothetical protein